MANVAHLQEADIEKIYLCPLFTGIEASTLASIIKKPYTKISEYEADTVVYKVGQKQNQLTLVLAGELGIVNTNLWKDSSVVEVAGSGSLIGVDEVLSSDNRLAYEVCAFEPSKVLTIDYNKLIADADISKVVGVISNNLLQAQIAHSKALNRHVNHLAQPTTRKKLLAYLSDEAKIAGSTTFDISLARQDLADYLAVERSAMCSELSRMQRDGLIDYHKNHFTLKKTAK